MNDLLKLAIEAHGGLQNWNKYEKVAVKMHVNGVLWTLKGQDGVLSKSQIEVDLRNQKGRYINFDSKVGQQTEFDPDRVAINDNGKITQELINPRDTFTDHKLETPWTSLQLVYFGTYAMWEYLTLPFCLVLPGFKTQEISPWHEAGETWRRLQIQFPDHRAYHSQQQVLYFDEKGLLKRLDYQVDISGGTTAAQYVFDLREFQGIKVPTRRLVYGRDEQNHYVKEPLVVGVFLHEVKFT